MKRLTLFILFIFFFGSLPAQDTLYFNADANPCSKNQAEYYKIYFQESGEGRIVEKTFYLTDTLRSVRFFQTATLRKKIDTSQSFYKNGKLNWTIIYDNAGKTLSLKQLHRNGKIKRLEFYKDGELTKGKKYDSEGKRVRFTKLQRSPTYRGGYQRMIDFLNRNIQYPAQAKDLNQHGTVIVSFIVTKAGKVEKARIEKSIHPLLDTEALRVVEIMKRWVAGSLDDKKVNTRLSIPITFGLPDAEE
jgi:TonB family protein